MKQENYVIGLDLGINNVGWSIVNLDEHKIEKSGVRLFNPSNDAKGRRTSRNARRRLKREKNRVNDSFKLLKDINFNEAPTIDTNIIETRVKGLKNKLSKQDIINIIKYFMTHRGYIPFDDEEYSFVELNENYPCEYYYNLYKTTGKYRALNETVKNSQLKHELEDILVCQQKYYPELSKIKEQLISIFERKRQFWEGPGSQKSLTPFGRFKIIEDVENYQKNKIKNPSYEKYLFEDLIGKCNILYLNERCAPIANIYAQIFNLLNDFINLTFIDITDVNTIKMFVQTSDGYKLNSDGLDKIIDYCINYNSTLKLDKMFKELFNLDIKCAVGYRENKDKKIEMSTLDAYRSILRLLKKYNVKKLENFELYNILIYYINVVPSSNMLIDMLKKDEYFFKYIKNENIELFKEIYKSIKQKYVGYHSLSEKALIQSINDMKTNSLNFQQVRMKFKYDLPMQKEIAKNYETTNGKVQLTDKYIDEIIASPQVKKTLRQAIKVINAIINEKKSLPSVISIESEKEVNGKEKIKEITAEQKINEGLRKQAVNIIESNGYTATEALINKVKLYQEINGYCPYCHHQKINLQDVLDNRIEVEHILPLSQSGDDSYNNKTLACRNCNDSKLNKTPYNWKKNADYEDFKKRIIDNKNYSETKKNNFLYEGDLDKYSIRFINRNLRDNAYATKELINQINMFNYYINDKYNIQIKTLSTPGQITHKIRENYDIKKDRDEGKFHHAVDACIVAAIADTKIGDLIIKTQNDKKYWLGDNKDNQKNLVFGLKNANIDGYYNSLNNIDSDDKIFISSQVNKSVQGQLSDANINKFINIDNKFYKICQVGNIYEADDKTLFELFNDESSKTHLMIKDNNPKLYKKLKEIYTEYKDIKGNPFKNYCFDKYRGEDFQELKEFNILKHGIKVSDKSNSPILKKMRYYVVSGSPYILSKNNINKKENTIIGLDKLKQYCTEIYYNKDDKKFIFLPIFSISVDLKNNKINRNDSYYLQMKEIYLQNKEVEYITTIYNGNYIEFTKKNGETLNGIYKDFHKTNNILIFKNDNTFTTNDLSFTIYDVDILGNKKKRLTYPEK